MHPFVHLHISSLKNDIAKMAERAGRGVPKLNHILSKSAQKAVIKGCLKKEVKK